MFLYTELENNYVYPFDFYFFSFTENRTGRVCVTTQNIVEAVIAVFRQLEKGTTDHVSHGTMVLSDHIRL